MRFCILDTETTGMGDSARIIELAIVEVTEGSITNRWEWLFNPGCHIPDFITRLTGIHDLMVQDAPSFLDCWNEIFSVLNGSILVAQQSSFDRGMFRNECRRMNIPEPDWTWLCTVRIGRRLWPGYGSYSLSAMAGRLNIRNKQAHRAMGDAETTAKIFIQQLADFTDRFPDLTESDLQAFQYGKVETGLPLPKSAAKLKELVSREFPEMPGVYWFENAKGEILYVGKAVNLKARVQTYFTGRHRQSGKTIRMVRLARQVRYLETHTELGALIQESRLIKQYQPPYNRLQLDYQSFPFLSLSNSHPFPRLNATRDLSDSSYDYFGPFASQFHAGSLRDWLMDTGWFRPCDDSTFAKGKLCTWHSLGKCPGPCNGTISEADYQARISQLKDFLSGKDRGMIESLSDSMESAAEDLQFETAARLRDRIKELKRIFLYFNQANGLSSHHLTAKRPLADGSFEFYLIRYGLLIHHGRVNGEVGNHEFQSALQEFQSLIATQPPPDYFAPEAVDEMRLVLNWLNLHRKELLIGEGGSDQGAVISYQGFNRDSDQKDHF